MLPDEREDDLLGSDISTSDEAVSQYMALDYLAVCTDGFNQPWLSACHPRNYGAFPRVLGDYVREKRVISLEQALRKMTVVPARAVGLTDRGVLAEGMWADVVVFDPSVIRDSATFGAPAAPDGFDVVLVNGTPMVDRRDAAGDGFQAELTALSTAGRVLRGPAAGGPVPGGPVPGVRRRVGLRAWTAEAPGRNSVTLGRDRRGSHAACRADDRHRPAGNGSLHVLRQR
jgi:hypothetical protein